MLVKAGKDGSEAKYMIRGLQGKLRIGLAQSTVLVSLSHAFALSPPPKVKEAERELLLDDNDSDDDDDHDEKGDDDRDDMKKKKGGKKRSRRGLEGDALALCDPNLPLETRLEMSTSLVKKAYSEVPSLDLLVNSLLRVPLPLLSRECALTPGIPVAPMLAKPTRSVVEVLKRLNGKRFTCEYKYDGERAQVHMDGEGMTKVFSRNL